MSIYVGGYLYVRTTSCGIIIVCNNDDQNTVESQNLIKQGHQIFHATYCVKTMVCVCVCVRAGACPLDYIHNNLTIINVYKYLISCVQVYNLVKD